MFILFNFYLKTLLYNFLIYVLFLNNCNNNSNDRNKIGFEDVKIAISNQSKYIIINTLSIFLISTKYSN